MFRTDYCGYNYHNPDKDIIYRPTGSGDYLFLNITSDMDFYFPVDSDVDIDAYSNNDVAEDRRYKSQNALADSVSSKAMASADSSVSNADIITRDGMTMIRKTAIPGDCILFTPGHTQYYKAHGLFSNSFVHFTCDADEIQGLQIPQNALFHPANDEGIVDCLRRISFEYLSKQTRRDRMIDLLIKELLICAERSLMGPAEEIEQSEIYSFLTGYRVNMLQRCSEQWSIEKICKETHLGRSQLYHYYRAFFFSSPKDDLNAARIDKAKHLLTNKELRISDVAAQCGFQNIYHFNRYFKQECGVTPGEYRIR